MSKYSPTLTNFSLINLIEPRLPNNAFIALALSKLISSPRNIEDKPKSFKAAKMSTNLVKSSKNSWLDAYTLFKSAISSFVILATISDPTAL